MKYDNYNVMVAGATSGIGLAITKMFLDEGATVIGMGRNFKNTADLGEKFIPCKCDVTSVADLENACNLVQEKFGGKLDVLINSAGASVKQPVDDVPPEQFDKAINLLLRPSVLLTSYCVKYLQACDSQKPVIIHISSAASRSIVPDNILYGICKHATNYYTKQAAGGLPGIRSFSISPGTIRTPIFGRGSHTDRSEAEVDAMLAQLSQAIPSGRVAEPEEIGDLVSFLCSDEASYLTGTDFLIDGGIMTMFS